MVRWQVGLVVGLQVFRQTDVNEIEALMLGEELEKLDPKTFKGENSELVSDVLFERNVKGMST